MPVSIRRLAFVFVLLFGAACTLPSRAPKKRVVLFEVRHAKPGQLKEALVEMLGDHYEIVSEAEYRATAKRLRARKITRRNVAKVAAELEAHATLQTAVIRRRGRRVLRVIVRDGNTGLVAGRHFARLVKRKLSDASYDSLSEGLVATVEAIVVPEPEPDESEDAVVEFEDDEVGSDEQAAVAPKDAAKNQKKPAKKAEPAAKKEAEEPARTFEHDERGQAVDDEMPEVLKD